MLLSPVLSTLRFELPWPSKDVGQTLEACFVELLNRQEQEKKLRKRGCSVAAAEAVIARLVLIIN